MSTSVGEQLRQARQARQLSTEQAAVTMRIRLRYLEALEAGDLSAFPSLTQARGFLRGYALYLGLDPGPLLGEISGEPPPSPGASPAAPEQIPISPELAAGADGSIFAQIGQKLRAQREVLGLSLDDIERQTHLRVHYLEALETGRLEGLPSPVQGRGMLKNYAAFLGMDPEPLLLRFAEGLQTRLSSRQRSERPAKPTPPVQKPPGPLRRLFSTEFLLGSVITLFLVAFLGWGALRISDLRAPGTLTPTAPSIADVLAPPATLTASPTAPRPTPTVPALPTIEGAPSLSETPEATQPAFGNAPIQVYVVVRQRSWMRVTVDGEVVFEGRATAGSAYPFPGNERVELLTGNAAGVQVFHNQVDLGQLGAFGEASHLIFTLGGMQTPTATLTPTGQPAPTATPTPPGTLAPSS
jgi:cytoskeletal protein RodZ